MGLLAVALAAHFTLHRSAVRDLAWHNATRQKLAAAVSVILWSGVV
jgi:hypothetical protein